nr:MAG TPA: centrosome-associated protein [Caudoviricetes sp.]
MNISTREYIESLIQEINPRVIRYLYNVKTLCYSICFRIDDEIKHIDNLSEVDIITLLEMLRAIKYDT